MEALILPSVLILLGFLAIFLANQDRKNVNQSLSEFGLTLILVGVLLLLLSMAKSIATAEQLSEFLYYPITNHKKA